MQNLDLSCVKNKAMVNLIALSEVSPSMSRACPTLVQHNDIDLIGHTKV